MASVNILQYIASNMIFLTSHIFGLLLIMHVNYAQIQAGAEPVCAP